MTTYNSFVREQKAEFLRQFINDTHYCYVRVKSLDDFRHRIADYTDGKYLADLDGFNRHDAIVWDPQNQPELWVRPEDKTRGLRRYAKAWRKFTKEFANADVEKLDPPHQIDHLSPETAAYRQGYSHVRVMAVDARPNGNVGRTIEKRLAQNSNRAGGFQADFAVAAKVIGMTGTFRKDRSGECIRTELLELLEEAGLVLNEQELEGLAGWIDYRRG